ncbi:MAG: response regulator [Polyangiaceae bacterium]
MSRSIVLVVDDQRDQRETIAPALEAEGYAVRCAENGAQALALMHGAGRPDAIVLDLSMPVMGGWELLEILRGEPELSEIPVVVLSALPAPTGTLHLAKPVSLGDLLEMLDRVRTHRGGDVVERPI